jgi:hypothetical protein
VDARAFSLSAEKFSARWISRRSDPHLIGGALSGLGSAFLAIAFASFALFGERAALTGTLLRIPRRFVEALQRVHGGLVTDYIAWLAGGTATLALALAVCCR